MDRKPGGARRRRRQARHPRPARRPSIFPAGSRPITQAQLYARVSGYLKEWKADIGTPVKTGQLLAEIDAPDLDQQIMQAQAALASAQANATLAAATLQRGQSLIPSGAVSKQDLDQRARRRRQQARPGRVGAGQSRPPARAGEIQAHHRAVRRPGHRAQHRRRHADQRRRGGGAPLFVVSDTSKLRALRQRAAELRAEHQDRHQGADLGSGISGPEIFRDRRSLRASRRRRLRHDPDAAASSTMPAAN